MSSQSVFRHARCAIFSLWAGAGAVAFDAIADPMLISGGEDMLAVPIASEPILEGSPRSAGRPVAIEFPLPHPMPDLIPFRINETARAQRGSSQVPENRRATPLDTFAHDGSAPRSGDISLQQLLRDYGYSSNQPAALPVSGDRARQRDVFDGGRRVEPGFSMAEEGMLRGAAVNVFQLMSESSIIDKDAEMLFVAQVGEFRAMFRGEFQSLIDSVSDLWPLALYEDAWSESAVKGMTAAEPYRAPSPGAMMFPGQAPIARPPADGPIANMTDFLIFILREFFTNPIAILATGGTLIL
jgi:hypothetical protein